jgi:hypothetical protein
MEKYFLSHVGHKIIKDAIIIKVINMKYVKIEITNAIADSFGLNWLIVITKKMNKMGKDIDNFMNNSLARSNFIMMVLLAVCII